MDFGHTVSIQFSAAQPERIFSEFKDKFEGTIVGGNELHFSKKYGDGILKKYDLEDGLILSILDMRLTYSLLFTRNPAPEQTYYPLFFHSSQSSVSQEIEGEKRLIQSTSPNAIFLPSPHIATSFFVEPKTHLQVIIIGFSKKWLFKNIRESEDSIKSAILSGEAFFIYESIDFGFQSIISDILQKSEDSNFLFKKTKSYDLVLRFLEKVNARKNNIYSNDLSNSDVDMLFKTKAILEGTPKKFPTVARLAREIGMSESQLQKKFKLVFGKNLYQYHLMLKLELARRLLESKKHSIREIGTILGYTHLGHFSGAFKKHFGCTPKEFLNR